MRFGDSVYWLEYDRPMSGAATVFVREGQYVRGEGRKLLVVEGGTTKFVHPVTAFATREEVECSAIGWCVRLVTKFKFQAAVAKWPDGSMLYSTVAPKQKTL